MHTVLYAALGWGLFLVVVYAYMFYDMYAAEIKLREKWNRLVNAFTEEE